MYIVNPPESVRVLTNLSRFERSVDGRPKVPDELIERMRLVTTEEAWSVMNAKGYRNQFEGDWLSTNPDRILVGRAVTAVMVPSRPDLNEVVEDLGREERRVGGQNTWVIDMLQEGDVLVVDCFGKIKDGTFVGDNLSTSMMTRTGAGAVIHGGIRDFQGVSKLRDLTIFCRGLHPTAIADMTLIGVNTPIRVGEATVLPGDVVLGTPTGVIFVPPHLLSEVVERSEDIRLRDAFSKIRLREGRYAPGVIDRTWTPEVEDDFRQWLRTARG
jgi:4-hydroxy-4-methyl-2-oxoglutarate aldolase